MRRFCKNGKNSNTDKDCLYEVVKLENFLFPYKVTWKQSYFATGWAVKSIMLLSSIQSNDYYGKLKPNDE